MTLGDAVACGPQRSVAWVWRRPDAWHDAPWTSFWPSEPAPHRPRISAIAVEHGKKR